MTGSPPRLHRPRHHSLRAVVTAACCLALVVGAGACGGGAARPASATRTPAGASTTSPKVAAVLHELERAQAASSSVNTDISPNCPEPALQPVQLPNGSSQGFGIPFTAALTGGKLVSGLIASEAAAGKGNPFGSSIYPIIGWVSGILEVPSLQSVIEPSGFTFCDGYDQTPLDVILKPGSLIPIVNCVYAGPTNPDCTNFFVFLTATQPATLNVTGVAPSGALELDGTTTASTEVDVDTNGTHTPFQKCYQYQPDTITVSSSVTGEPASAAPGTTLQSTPTPLTGPLSSASATLASNSFDVPSFEVYAGTPTTLECYFGNVLNQVLGGFSKVSNKGSTQYYTATCPPNSAPYQYPCGPYAGRPGWSQISIEAQITQLGLPVGPPQGFGL